MSSMRPPKNWMAMHSRICFHPIAGFSVTRSSTCTIPGECCGEFANGSPPSGSVVACIPNAQHWSVQARLNNGLFRYEDAGLLDRTHIRWFTRITMMELFDSTGFRIVEGGSRVMNEPGRDKFLAAIKVMAQANGIDPEQAASDAVPIQWVVRAEPK